jgi:hypothetical protein
LLELLLLTASSLGTAADDDDDELSLPNFPAELEIDKVSKY